MAAGGHPHVCDMRRVFEPARRTGSVVHRGNNAVLRIIKRNPAGEEKAAWQAKYLRHVSIGPKGQGSMVSGCCVDNAVVCIFMGGHVMEVLNLVRTIKPSGIKANYMHGKLHDLIVTFRHNMKCSRLDALVLAESLTSWWPFCSHTIISVKNGYWQVEIEYKIKREQIAEFQRIFSLQSEKMVVR